MILDVTMWGMQMIDGNTLQSSLLFGALVLSLAASNAIARRIESKMPHDAKRWIRVSASFLGLVVSFFAIMSLLFYLVMAYLLGYEP